MIALKDLFNRMGSSNLLFDGEKASSAQGVDLRYLNYDISFFFAIEKKLKKKCFG